MFLNLADLAILKNWRYEILFYADLKVCSQREVVHTACARGINSIHFHYMLMTVCDEE